MLEKLIGAQIVEVTENTLTVSLNGKEHELEISSDDGDCCGYADFKTLVFDENDIKRNPIITNIEVTPKAHCSGDEAIITFYGESSEILSIEGEAGSGSGWEYGACVTITCKTLEIEENLVSW